jgi:hypothetical protein
MPPKGKRKATNPPVADAAPEKKESRRWKEDFADDIPYEFRKGLDKFFSQFIANDEDEDDEEGAYDDGFDAALAIEEEFEEKVEGVARLLGRVLQTGEQPATGIGAVQLATTASGRPEP